jgi:hypothetical protein
VLDAGDVNGQYQGGKGNYCRINGTQYDANAALGVPAVQADYNYPWQSSSGATGGEYFYRQLANKVLWCDNSSPYWPRNSTITSCNGGVPVPGANVRANLRDASAWSATRRPRRAITRLPPCKTGLAVRILRRRTPAAPARTRPERARFLSAWPATATWTRCRSPARNAAAVAPRASSTPIALPCRAHRQLHRLANPCVSEGRLAGVHVRAVRSVHQREHRGRDHARCRTPYEPNGAVSCAVTTTSFTRRPACLRPAACSPTAAPTSVTCSRRTRWAGNTPKGYPLTQTGTFTVGVSSGCPAVGTIGPDSPPLLRDRQGRVLRQPQSSPRRPMAWFGAGSCQVDNNDLQRYKEVKYGKFTRVDLFASNTLAFPGSGSVSGDRNTVSQRPSWLAGATPGPGNSESHQLRQLVRVLLDAPQCGKVDDRHGVLVPHPGRVPSRSAIAWVPHARRRAGGLSAAAASPSSGWT